MTMKLYFNPHSRAVIAKWILDEAGADYEIVPISFEKHEHKAMVTVVIEGDDAGLL